MAKGLLASGLGQAERVGGMQTIEGLLFEPVGCLAEFPSAPFHEIAVSLFGRKGNASPSGSRAYWHLLNLMGETPPSRSGGGARNRGRECGERL